ncbi:hypothetical protein LCGC14_0878570 [marine sediment metagenome]|uniref:Uncharacterized protein n=1 Tax=marine sediment metagenome TaxID=412755 RepID=A0A0F9RM23_9ZZZZ
MADITVLERDTHNRWRVAMHFPVPAGNNAAGVPWRGALVASGIGGTTVLPNGDGTGGTISAADKALIQSGALLEHVESVRLGAGNPQAAAEELYNSRKADKTAQLQARLNQYGRNVDVP